MLLTVLFLTCLQLVAARNGKRCKNIAIPFYLTARNVVFNTHIPNSQIEVTNFMLDLTRHGRNLTNELMTGYRQVSGVYELSTTYCEPKSGPGSRLQILTHGIGFDRHYWDFYYNNYKYSYVNKAIENGWSTLTWDRPGVGHSSKGNALTEIQIALEVAALRALTQWVKDGFLPQHKHKNSKIVHAGHSFGSSITMAMTHEYPHMSDGIILTGFSQIPNFFAAFLLATGFVPAKDVFESYTFWPGYFSAKTEVALMVDFFAPNDFDPSILGAAMKTGQPATIGELLTLGSIPAKSNFAGPVQIVTGQRDIPFCGGDCNFVGGMNTTAKSMLEMSRRNFPYASTFSTNVIPNAGHGLNYQYSYNKTYTAMHEFLNYQFPPPPRPTETEIHVIVTSASTYYEAPTQSASSAP
ncbi:hypothetical protein HIM_04103 [Hirsutella minnesotensis 3608]|uniref:AB hydrolase-1 domain-containing protein n=1 Tax=Hirsutella minnesotensis 3608 TaxID=1043627 RepID=A0A0F8A632_9HYPO|nr:hypothetical protein HIM_04103 [Hirsutella minnesotensis 3608]